MTLAKSATQRVVKIVNTEEERKMTIGKLIKVLAVTEDVSITELAKRTGVSRQGFYKRLENGIDFDVVQEIFKILGYDLYYGKDGDIRKI